jgi:hypothetical protein
MIGRELNGLSVIAILSDDAKSMGVAISKRES